LWLIADHVSNVAGWLSGDTQESVGKALGNATWLMKIIYPMLQDPGLCLVIASALLGFYCLGSDWILSHRHNTIKSSAPTNDSVVLGQVDLTSAEPDGQLAKNKPFKTITFKSKLKPTTWKLLVPDENLRPHQKPLSNIPESPHGKALLIDIPRYNGITYRMPPQNAKCIEFIIEWSDRATPYIGLCLAKNGIIDPDFWFMISASLDQADPKQEFPPREWKIYVPHEQIGPRGWWRLVIDVDKHFADTFAKQGYSLVGINAIRFRGKQSVASINFYDQPCSLVFPPIAPSPATQS
jgi:hypothetical protein